MLERNNNVSLQVKKTLEELDIGIKEMEYAKRELKIKNDRYDITYK